MLEFKDVDIALVTKWQADFADVLLVMTNEDELSASGGVVPWIRVKIMPRSANQLGLGDPTGTRQYGVLLFIIYARKGEGTMDRDMLYQRVVNSFRGRLIGGATCTNVQPVQQVTTDNWFVSAYQIPFFFDSM